jgi:DNA repair exonuclease SbcCD ATPase subunit
MEAKVLIPLISGFMGAIIGALSSIVAIWIQQKAQSKRDKLKLASEMAKDDHKLAHELAKEHNIRAKIFPVLTYQHFHYEILSALENGKLNDKKLQEIQNKNKELIDALNKFEENL